MSHIKEYGPILLIAMLIIIGGCLQAPREKQPVAQTLVPTPAPTPTPTPTPAVTPLPVITPAPSPRELPPDALYVSARMLKPSFWGEGRYELISLEAEVRNQMPTSVSIRAQIVSGSEILEEKNFTLENQGSSYVLVNEKRHFISSPDVVLRLIIQGYKPVEYRFVVAGGLS